MIPSERMVWAAAYSAKLLNLHEFRRHHGGPGDMRGDAVQASEFAWAAVDELRRSMADVREGFGDNSDVTRMHAEMIYG